MTETHDHSVGNQGGDISLLQEEWMCEKRDFAYNVKAGGGPFMYNEIGSEVL